MTKEEWEACCREMLRELRDEVEKAKLARPPLPGRKITFALPRDPHLDFDDVTLTD